MELRTMIRELQPVSLVLQQTSVRLGTAHRSRNEMNLSLSRWLLVVHTGSLILPQRFVSLNT